MKTLLDFLPIVLFFGAFKFYGIYVATAVLMAATVVQMAIIYGLERQLSAMHKITLLLVLAFGCLTLVLHDERFIKWKPTVLYGLMAVALAVAAWVYKKNFLKVLLGARLTLPESVWLRLNLLWVIYSVFMAALNAYVAVYFSTEDWVNFKIWGYVFPLAFLLIQGFYIARYLGQEQQSKP